MRDIFFGDWNRLAASRIAPGARRMVVQTETSKAADLASIPLCKGAPDGVKDFLHSGFGVLRDQVWEPGCDGGDEI